MFSTIKEVDIVAKNIHNKLTIKFDSTTSVYTPGCKREDTGFPGLKDGANTVCRSIFADNLYSPVKEHSITVKPVTQILSQPYMTPKRLFTGKNKTSSNSSPLQLSPKETDLRDYFTVTGNTPTSVGVVEIQSSTPTKPCQEIKKIRLNWNKMLNEVEGSSPSTSSTKPSMCRSLTYLSYGSLYPKYIRPVQDKKRKVKVSKKLPKAKRQCQNNKLTAYFGTSPSSNVNVAIEVCQEVMAETGTQASMSSPPAADQSGSVVSVNDTGVGRSPLRDRKNLALMNAFEEVVNKSPTSVSPFSRSTISPHNKTRPIWLKDGTNNLIFEHMKAYYTKTTSAYHKKVACYRQTNYNISTKKKSSLQNMEVITIPDSDDEIDLERCEEGKFPIRNKDSVTDLTAAPPSSICYDRVPEQQESDKEILSQSMMQKDLVIDLTAASSPSVYTNKVPEQDSEKEILSPSMMQNGSVVDLTVASSSLCGNNNVRVQNSDNELCSPPGKLKGSLIDLTVASPDVCYNNVPVQDSEKVTCHPSMRPKGSFIDLTISSPSVSNNVPVIDLSVASPSVSYNKVQVVQPPNGEKESDVAEEASVSPLLQGMLIRKGVPLIMCSRFDYDKSVKGRELGHKLEMDLTKGLTCLPPVSSSSMPSAVLNDINIRSVAMKSQDKTIHLQAPTTTQSVNTMATESLITSVTARQNHPQIQEIQDNVVPSSSDNVHLQSRISHDNPTMTVKDVSSSEQTRENMLSRCSSVSSGTSSVSMSTIQLISYINEVTDKWQKDPAKRLGLVAPLCLRRSTPCFHVKHWQASKFFINRLRLNATFELYSLHLSSSTNFCSRDRYLDVATLQWIVHFILNHGDIQLAVEAMSTLRTLVDGWPPCTPRAHLYYIKFLSEPYEYTTSNNMGLFEMLLLKIEGMFTPKKEKEFVEEDDEDYPGNGDSCNEDDLQPTKHDNIKSCFHLCSTAAAEEMQARKAYDYFTSAEQKERLAAVLDTVAHIMEQDMIVYLMDKDHDQLRGLTSPMKQPLVVNMVWRGQSIRGIGTVTTMCRRIVKLYLLSSGMLRRSLARLVSLMAEVVASSELTKNSYSYIGPKCYDYAREILNLIPNAIDVTNDIVVELKPSWLTLTIIHLRLCRLMETDRPISLDVVIACLNILVNPLPSSYDCSADKKPTKVNRRNPKGESRLHIVCRSKKKIDEVRLLLNDPAIDVNIKDNAGWTPLHEAISVGNLQCVELMLNYRPGPGGRIVDVKAKGPNGLTVLMEAVNGEWYDICEMLLKQAGWCLLEDKDDNGLTCKDIAKSPQVVEVLQAAKTSYPHKTALSQPSLSARTLTPKTLSEVTRLVPAYVCLYLNTYQMQEITNMAKANARVQNEAKRNYDYQEYFYGLKNVRTVKKLAKVGKRNPNLDPIVRGAFDIAHPLIAS